MSTLHGVPLPGTALLPVSTGPVSAGSVSAGSVSTTTLAVGMIVSLLVGIAVGLLGAWLAGRRRAAPGRAAVPAAGDGAPRTTIAALDDLPGFFDYPPGAPAPAPAPAPVPAAATRPAPAGGPSALATTSAMVAAAVVLVLLAVVVAIAADRDPARPRAASATGSPTATAPPQDTPPAETAAPMPEPATDPAAAALAFTSIPLGAHGAAATLTFGGLLLEQRAVGLTVTYPSLSVSTDGERALAHVRLPTFNCLTPEPPTDPMAAGCIRSLTEYADLPAPDLRVSRNGDRLDVQGLFRTYTRPNGAPPTYTGRAYQLAASVFPQGPVRDGRAAAEGVFRIGMDSAASTAAPGVNLLQFAG